MPISDPRDRFFYHRHTPITYIPAPPKIEQTLSHRREKVDRPRSNNAIRTEAQRFPFGRNSTF